MSTKLANNLINLADLQDDMNFIVLNYMNDYTNWSMATEKLEILLSQTSSFFYEFIQGGERPQLNEYWLLFAKLSSKLCLNYGVAVFNHLNSIHTSSQEFAKVENALLTAAMIMPNSNEQEFLKYLQHMEETYKQSVLRQEKVLTMSFVESIFSQNNNLEKNLINFYTNIRGNFIPS